jgi:hypothetical protein
VDGIITTTEDIVNMRPVCGEKSVACLLLFLFIVEIAIATGLPQLLILGDEEGL